MNTDKAFGIKRLMEAGCIDKKIPFPLTWRSEEWMRDRNTLEFLGTWGKKSNPSLNWSNSTGLKMKQD